MSTAAEHPTSTCRHCDAPLTAAAPGGHCPRCLFWFSAGLDFLDAEPDRTVDAAGPIPGMVERYFGDYEIQGELAHGGMGVVYRARQISLNRPVALKMITTGQGVTAAQLERFRVEAEAAARLDHPHIVSVYEVGEVDGRPFYSMRLVEGGSLAARMAEFRPASVAARDARGAAAIASARARTRRVAVLVRDVALALQHAHQRGVLHRDLKPSNILLDEEGQPHLADFGLARLDDSDAGLTRTHAVMGTPHYMSPEQAAGHAHELTIASDLFSLGAIFYELLAGEPPFTGETALAVLLAVRENTPRGLRVLDPGIDQDLETVCLRCLEKDPSRRYPSARALAEDLDAWLAGRPISARPTGGLERALLWSRRRPALAALSAALFVALTVGLLGVLWQSSGRRRALEEARRNLYVAQVQSAQQAWERGDVDFARSLLRAQIPKPGEEDLRGFEWRHLGRLCRDESRSLPFDLGDFGRVRSLAFTPGGELAALGSETGEIQLRHMSDGELLRTLRAGGGTAFTLEFSRDGSLLLAGGDRTVVLWDVPQGRILRKFTLTNPAVNLVTSAHLSPDGRWVAAGGYPGHEVQLWNAATGQSVAPYTGPLSDTRCNAFTLDGRFLAMDLGDGPITVVSLDGRDPPRFLGGHAGAVGQFEISPDGGLLASSDAHGSVKLWRVQDWQEVATLGASASLVTTLSFSADGRLLACGRRDGLIHVWDTRAQVLVGTLRGHLGWITRVAIHPDGRRLFSCGDDQVRVWDLPFVDEQPRFQTEPIVDFIDWDHTRFSPDGRRIATLGAGSPARRVWDAVNGKLVMSAPGRGRGAAFSADSQYFAAGDDAGRLRVWRSGDGREVVSLPVVSNVVGVAFASGQLLAAIEGDESVRRWDTRDWTSLPAWTGYEGGVAELLASPDGQVVAAWGKDGNLRQQSVADGVAITPIPIADEFPQMAYSPDGRWIAIHSRRSQTDQLWDARAGALHHAFDKPQSGGGDLGPVFSPDGRLIAVGGREAKIEWWDIAHRRLVAQLRWPGDSTVRRASSMAFAPDGRTFVMCDNRGTVRFWSVPMRREVLIHSTTAGYGKVSFAPDGSTLAIHNIFRNNLLLRADSLQEVEASLRAGQDAVPSPFLP